MMIRNHWISGWLLLCLLAFVQTPVGASEQDKLYITVRTSPESDFYSMLVVSDNQNVARQIRTSKVAATTRKPEPVRATIQIGKRQYRFDALNHLYEQSSGKRVLLSSETTDILADWVRYVERAHYGTPLEWGKMKRVLPRMGYADVIDLETGETFRVQRRAGNRHADVQPLTRKDTDTMKRIYQGKWSWKRRAILVVINGKYYAASMNGMPHGAGAIAGNGFNGHFCIHFTGSTTHKRKVSDPAHNLMIAKSSGKLQERIFQAKPIQLVEYFLLSVREQDNTILTMTKTAFPLPFEVTAIKGLKWDELQQKNEPDSLTAVIPAKVAYERNGKGKQTDTWVFLVERNAAAGRWIIAGISTKESSTELQR